MARPPRRRHRRPNPRANLGDQADLIRAILDLGDRIEREPRADLRAELRERQRELAKLIKDDDDDWWPD